MTRNAAFMRRLLTDDNGSMAVEFGLLGPLLLALLLGVLQVGMAMQAYNALRNVSADVARYAAVQYQTDNRLTNTQIRQYAITTGVTAPYLLINDNLTVSVTDAPTQRVTGARELTLTLNYEFPTILTYMGFSSPTVDYERPIFLIS